MVRRVNESVDYSSSRQTVQWPFQHRTNTESHASTPTTLGFPRRATWQAAGHLMAGEESPTESVEKDLIPDYVVNYIRGETPETLALKKALNQRRGARDVGVEGGNGNHFSRAADFYASDESRTTSHSDLERILPAGNEKRRRGERDGEGGGGFRRLMTGWRGGVAINTAISFAILVATIVCLTLAVARAQMLGGEMAIFVGGCRRASQISWGLLAAINILVVVLVAIANYIFQILGSPTRAEVAAQHDMKRWLDIGIPSVRNLRAVSGGRVLVVVIILVAALSTQIM
jgi:hypothetical protein